MYVKADKFKELVTLICKRILLIHIMLMELNNIQFPITIIQDHFITNQCKQVLFLQQEFQFGVVKQEHKENKNLHKTSHFYKILIQMVLEVVYQLQGTGCGKNQLILKVILNVEEDLIIYVVNTQHQFCKIRMQMQIIQYCKRHQGFWDKHMILII